MAERIVLRKGLGKDGDPSVQYFRDHPTHYEWVARVSRRAHRLVNAEDFRGKIWVVTTSSTLRRSPENTSRWMCGAMAAAETRSARTLAIGSSIGSLTIRVLPTCGGASGRTGCTSATLKRSRSISSPHLRDRLDRMRNMRSTCTSHTLSGRHRPGSGVGADPGGRRRGVSPSRKRTRAM